VINVHHSARAPCRGLFSGQPRSGAGRLPAGPVRLSSRCRTSDPGLGAIGNGGGRRAIGHGRQKETQMAMQFRVMVEIEGSSPDTFKIGFEFSDEEESDIEFYSNHDLPEDVTEKLGALALDFINNIGDLVLPKLH
jgi:hypothetical protein